MIEHSGVPKGWEVRRTARGHVEIVRVSAPTAPIDTDPYAELIFLSVSMAGFFIFILAAAVLVLTFGYGIPFTKTPSLLGIFWSTP